MTDDINSPAATRMSLVIDQIERARLVAKDTHDKAIADRLSSAVADQTSLVAFQTMFFVDAKAPVDPCDCPVCNPKPSRNRNYWALGWFAFDLLAVPIYVVLTMQAFARDDYVIGALDAAFAVMFAYFAVWQFKQWRRS